MKVGYSYLVSLEYCFSIIPILVLEESIIVITLEVLEVFR